MSTSDKDAIFKQFVAKYPQTGYGDESSTRGFSIDQRLDKPLKLMQRATMQAYTPDLLTAGAEVEALVFKVVTGAAALENFMDSYSTAMGLLPRHNTDVESFFACRCYVLSAPTTRLIDLKACRQKNQLMIDSLPMFYGTGDPPVEGDIIRAKYYEDNWQSGRFLEHKVLGGRNVNIATMMWLSPSRASLVSSFENSSPQPISAYDDTSDFGASCQMGSAEPRFDPENLRPSGRIIRQILKWEGYQPYVYDTSRKGHGRWSGPTGDSWDIERDRNHSGFVTGYDKVQGEPAIGVGHIITEAERDQYSAFFKGDTALRGYSPGNDPSPFTANEAEKLLRLDLNPIADAIGTSVELTLTQDQFDALCSLVHNIGIEEFNNSRVLRYLNEGNCDLAAGAFVDHIRVNAAATQATLRARRKAEARRFAGAMSNSLRFGRAEYAPGGVSYDHSSDTA